MRDLPAAPDAPADRPSSTATAAPGGSLGQEVPAGVIPPGSLPPLRYRDLPDALPLRAMVGPGIILAGLALGSGEYVLWPYITYKSQFVFFWASVVGVTMQYFINMEITRWTLATGETALTGFCRMSRHWPWVFLVMNVVPYLIPAWAKGAAQLVSWLIWGPGDQGGGAFVTELAMAGLVLCGVVLAAGPVVYETVERLQMILVTLVMVLVIVIAGWLLWDRPDAIAAQARATVTLGYPSIIPPLDDDLTAAMLLAALAFAGCGGTLNLAQSDYIRDKGYGMGRYIGRITSPITGQEEPISEVGYHFPATAANLERWRRWWRNAGWEHFLSFYLTCLVCLVLLTLISYTLFYDEQGQRLPGAAEYHEDMNFILGQANGLAERIGYPARVMFLVVGIAILLTTEFGILDAASRISTDIVKVRWLRENPRWTESRLYYLFLWGTIVLGCLVLYFGTQGNLIWFKTVAAMNGGVMWLYSCTLMYLNIRCLPPALRMCGWRRAVMSAVIVFFGFFAIWATCDTLRAAYALLGG